MYKEWKWSTGEPYYKSARIEHKQNLNQNQNQNQDFSYDSQLNAINQSLADEPFLNSGDNDLINITNSVFSRNQNPSGTRRENIDLKMSDREMDSE